MKGSSIFNEAGGSLWREHLSRGAVVKRVRELVEFCRIQGYRREEVIQIIETLP